MEENSESTPGSEWEKLPVFDLSFHNLGTGSSSKNPDSTSIDSFPQCNFENITKMQNISETNSSSSTATASSSEPIFSLWPEKQKENRDSSSVSASSMATRITRVSQNPSCQVEGCNIDLTLAKEYHRRHKICEGHSKSPKVIVAGLERRFCQQCSRFHNLSEFDDKKRSCRRRLSVHNARRRRLQPVSIQLSSGVLPSALYDRRPQNLLLNGHPISAPNSTWEDTGNFIVRPATNSLFSQTNGAGFQRTLSFSGDEFPTSISNLPLSSEGLSLTQSSTPRVLDNCLNGHTAISQTTPDLQSAHSLLSPTSWSLNQAESMSMESFMHGNYNSVRAGFQFDNVSAEQRHNVHSVNLQDAGPSLMQEFHLLKDTYEQSGCFYSGQRNS